MRSRLSRFALFGLLPSISARLDFHQTHKGAIETTGAGKTQSHSDVTNSLVGLHEKLASRIEPDFRDKLAIARAAHAKLPRGALQVRPTVSHRYGNSRPDRMSGR